jgi:hypothetical protein
MADNSRLQLVLYRWFPHILRKRRVVIGDLTIQEPFETRSGVVGREA